MEFAKTYFEQTEHTPVVAGYLCPSSDGYVSHKLGFECIALQKRCHLSDLALASSSWLSTNDWGMANAAAIIRATETKLNEDFKEYKFKVYLVAGADHVHRHGLYANYNDKIVCIARSEDTLELKKAISRSAWPNPNLVLMEGGEDISSTKVRKLILAENWGALVELLDESVLAHIKAIGKNVFKYNKQ